jgi:DNA-binding GntR family transcriptional regulator
MPSVSPALQNGAAAGPAGRGPEPLQRTTVRDLAEQSLRSMILTGRFPPGSRLNEVVLANELGISRGPLREAIQILAGDGLLSIVRHRGAYVRTVSEDELRELYHMRIALETYAVRLAAKRTGDEPQAQLALLLSQTVEAFGADGAYPPDFDFHRDLIGLMDNAVMQRAAADIHARVYLARARSAWNPERARVALDEHSQVVAAIRLGDEDGAARLLESHLWASFATAAELLRDSTEAAEDQEDV